MLATGASMELSYKALVKEKGTPEHTHIINALASKEWLDYTINQFPWADIRVGDVDGGTYTDSLNGEIIKGLNKKFYIVPWLGDSGDLSFGIKDDGKKQESVN